MEMSWKVYSQMGISFTSDQREAIYFRIKEASQMIYTVILMTTVIVYRIII